MPSTLYSIIYGARMEGMAVMAPSQRDRNLSVIISNEPKGQSSTGCACGYLSASSGRQILSLSGKS